MNLTFGLAGILLAGFAAMIIVFASIYTVQETEQVILTQFGKPVGDPITEAGLHFKIPFIQDVNRIEKRILEWDGGATDMPTKEKTTIIVDTFARWRISDSLQYFLRLHDEPNAIFRLNDILDSETRNAIAKHELIEVIRTTRDRTPLLQEALPGIAEAVSTLYPINRGRSLLEEDIFDRSKDKLAEFGIDLLDIRFKRINYNPSVQEKIYLRMISERKQIADRFRSEGAGEAARILGNKERDLKKIESEAYKEIQTIHGEADAKATEIYAKAYDQSPEAREFYEFLKTMETYQTMLNEDTTLILSTDSDIFRYLKDISPGKAKEEGALPAQR